MSKQNLKKIIREALIEDAAEHDLTTRLLVPKDARARAILLAKQNLVVCGLDVAKQVFQFFDKKIQFKPLVKKGELVKSGRMIAQITGKAQSILSAERVALNFLQRLSGISTLTRRFVEQTRGTEARILDTRKTTPSLRELEREAVRVGGGDNHRPNLRSAIMVKDNHLQWVERFDWLSHRLRSWLRRLPVIVEVKNLAQLREALEQSFPWIQLDNMSIPMLRQAVHLAQGKALLEATGGVTLKNIRRIAQTGVDYISIGALTHSAPAVDISLEMTAL